MHIISQPPVVNVSCVSLTECALTQSSEGGI